MHTHEFAKLLEVIVKEYQGHMEQELSPTLTTSQLTVLELLEQQDQLKPSDLIPYLSTTPAAVTMLLDRMERGELIRRVRDEGDRRIVWVSITEKGKHEVVRGVEVRNSYLSGILDRISTHNQQLLVYLLGKISGVPAKVEAK
ncbi:DNA-binding transcriptional regulator, MarR family [Fontibacillus panacisegetis]|uniref:DNA-binding transcriptional regulator, MarR family n=1 Tax=Fontibacillus panacisegetis TaxID=670482 RepID=A0A1G7KV23_9BACL|nr:MarR family transcriptional regulator [Fontibacillus panacisegetis]SDF40579.1 DNA-binding transcriptional regulator, MarR family [Fontibacillus panacisegetis]